MEKKFAALFDGFSSAYGKYVIKRKNAKGKMEGSAFTVQGKPDAELWKEHLSGKAGIGIIPLRDDDTCKFAVIDIDKYDIDVNALEKKVHKHKLKLIPCISKSGGVHLYAFFKEPQPAEIVVEKLHEWAALLGYGDQELFPKQTYRSSDLDIGNWINIPYFGDKRPAVHKGKEITKEQFVSLAEASLIDNLIEHESKLDDKGLFENGPPCLRYLGSFDGEHRMGFPEGTRNNGMYNIGVYLRKRFPDNWQDKVAEYNLEMCDPPLGHTEVNAMIKSLNKKDYEYQCKQAPICDHCNKSQCRKQKFGIGDTATGGRRTEIGSITKYAGEPVIWVVEIEGVRIEMETNQLISQTEFNKICIEKLNRCPGSLAKKRWETYLDEKLQDAVEVPVPVEASHAGQFWLHVLSFCTMYAQATTREDLARNLPLREDGIIMFRSQALITYLNQNYFRTKSEHHVYQMLRNQGADNKTIAVKDADGKNHSMNVWYIPEPSYDQIVEEPDAFKPSFMEE